jgi:hypothetical protein
MWKDPAFSGELNNFLVVALGNRATGERIYEDTFVAELEEQGIRATPGYQVFGDQKPSDEQILRDTVREGGYNAVIITSLVGVDERTSYTPGYVHYVPRVYRSYWGNYYYFYDRIRDPGYFTTYKVVRLETSVWKIGVTEQLVWSGQSETFSPDSAESVSEQVVNLITDELAEENIIA